MKRTTVWLDDGDLETVQAIAAAMGYLAERGQGAGRIGSLSQLLRAIAQGEIRITTIRYLQGDIGLGYGAKVMKNGGTKLAGRIPDGTEVEILSHDSPAAWAGGPWLKVQWDKITGWVQAVHIQE